MAGKNRSKGRQARIGAKAGRQEYEQSKERQARIGAKAGKNRS